MSTLGTLLFLHFCGNGQKYTTSHNCYYVNQLLEKQELIEIKQDKTTRDFFKTYVKRVTYPHIIC